MKFKAKAAIIFALFLAVGLILTPMFFGDQFTTNLLIRGLVGGVVGGIVYGLLVGSKRF
jgi:hypothetical protein